MNSEAKKKLSETSDGPSRSADEQSSPYQTSPAEASDQDELARRLENRIYHLEEELNSRKAVAQQLEARIREREAEIERMKRTLGWRLLSLFGPLKYGVLLPLLRVVRPNRKRIQPRAPTYRDWSHSCEAFRYNPERAAEEISRLQNTPLISILMIVHDPPIARLRAALQSVIQQYYPRWELCVAERLLLSPEVRALVDEYAARENRIKVLRPKADSSAADAIRPGLLPATGEFVGLLDQIDELTPDALYQVAAAINESGGDFFYSDEDRRAEDGSRSDPVFKPAWSPDLLLSCNYTGQFSVYSKELLARAGGIQPIIERDHHYDVALRCSELAETIVHIPKVLYHRGAGPDFSARELHDRSGERALADALVRRGIEGRVEQGVGNSFRIRRRVVRPERVSIIIPLRDHVNFLNRCLKSIESRTDYEDYEILIVDNGSREPATLEYLEHTIHRVIRHDRPFNFSRLNNIAAREAAGEYLLLLNNDTEVVSGEWLSAMVEQAQREEVGAVGAKLLYPDDSIQHAGVILGLNGVAEHAHRFGRPGAGGVDCNSPNVIRNYCAVTAACMMVRREVYWKVGGLNERELARSFNDVDFCLRLSKGGYLIVYTPYAVLYHHEFASRTPRMAPEELSYVLTNWRRELMFDPYYNPNLTFPKADFSVDLGKPESLCCAGTQDDADAVLTLLGGEKVGQHFFMLGDGLSAVAVRLATYSGPPNARIRLQLMESSEAGGALRAAEVEVRAVQENNLCTFHFEPVRNSAGKQFFFRLEILLADSEGRLTIWRSNLTDPTAGPVYKNGHPEEGTLCFSTFVNSGYRAVTNGRVVPESSHTQKEKASQITGAGAPARSFGVNVAGYIKGEFGLGEAVRAMIRALQTVNVPTALNNREVSWHRNRDTSFSDFSAENPYRINLIGVNVDQAAEFYNQQGRRYFEGHHNIAAWFWELSTFPEEWLERFKPYQEVWVASRFTADALARVSPVPVVKVTYPAYVDEGCLRGRSGLQGVSLDSYIFLFVFDYRSVFERKNPMALIQAFKRAFHPSEDATLIIKTINSEFDPVSAQALREAAAGLRVRLIDGHIPGGEIYSMIGTADCYVSLHRSEGLGITLAQSMYLGKPVIATGYSGNLEFMDVNNSLLVRYGLVDIECDTGPYKKGGVWADPDIEHAAELMRLVYEDRTRGTQLGVRASADMRRWMSPEAAGNDMLARLLRV